MQRGNSNEDVESEQLAVLPAGARTGSRPYHWRQPGIAARRCLPTTIDTALARLTASAAAIRAYLNRLKELDQWLTDRLKALDVCLGRIRRVEQIVSNVEPAPTMPNDCPPYLLLVACYADLARQALYGPSVGPPAADCCLPSSITRDQSDGDVKTSLTPDSLFGPLHDAAVAAGIAVLSATDQRVGSASLHEGADAPTSCSVSPEDSLTAEQQREYKSLMSILPPVQKSGRKLGDILSQLVKSLYQITLMMGDDASDNDLRQETAKKVLQNDELRPFNDFVANSRPIVRTFVLPEGRKLVLSADANQNGGNNVSPSTGHEAPSGLLARLVDVVCADVTRRFQTESYGAHLVLGQLTRRLDTAPRAVDGAAELARELETHCRLLEMSSRYDNMDALTQSLVTCAVERVRSETTLTIDKCNSGCPCNSVYHVVVE